MMTTMTDDDDARDAQARGVTAGYREDVAEESFVVRGARGDARGERRDVGWMGTDEWASFPQTGAGDEDAADADDETDRGRAMIADGVAWIGRATIERVDSLRCERERVERAGWERRRRARRDAANASREAPRRRETDDATFARIVAIHRPEPHIMLFKRKKSEE